MEGWILDIQSAIRQEFSDLPTLKDTMQVTVRLFMAVLLGGVLGYERESAGAAAGFRTHMLVSLGSALFVLAPGQLGFEGDAMSRVLQGVIAGIGFLGAGAIVKLNQDFEVRGLTTAASIWFTASVGICAGLGRESLAILGTLFALFILRILREVKRHGIRRRRQARIERRAGMPLRRRAGDRGADAAQERDAG